MQHTFTNAREPIRGEEGEKIEGSHHNYQDSNHSMDTITSYLRGDTKYSTMSNIRSEMSDRNLGAEEKCNISPGLFFIESVSSGNNICIDDKVELKKPKMIHLYGTSYIRSLGNNEYAINAPYFEKYVRVPKSGNFHTVNTQTYVGSYERFYITCFDNGDVAFKSKKHGNYLRENGNEIDTYKSSVSSIRDNMKWRLINEGVGKSPKPDVTYYIKSARGTYIYMNDKNEVKFMKHNKSYERITIRSVCCWISDGWGKILDCDNIYAIKSATHGERYLSVPGTGRGQTVGVQTYVGAYEMFYMETKHNGKVTFKSREHGNYLHANKDKKKLDTTSANGAYTRFTLVPV